MIARALHRCIHVLDLEKSIAFYRDALGLEVVRRMGPEDHSWEIVFMGCPASGFQMELTWNDGRTEPYVNGGRDAHMAFAVPDIEAARELHERMGCVCFVNQRMGLYFIEDPDGCWIEILEEGRNGNQAQTAVDVRYALNNRRSVRKYTGEAIPDDALMQVVDAGLVAAAGRGLRPWELIVVRNKETLRALSECRVGSAQMLAGADAAVVVVADPAKADTWIEDCSLVMGNMYVAADAQGLGCCWIQSRMRQTPTGQSTSDYVRGLLGVPEGFEVEAIMSLGVPAEHAAPLDPAAFRDKVHFEQF